MIDDFLRTSGIIFDVRSPKEFEKGHIPEAVSLPLFTNEERAAVGPLYKQQGQKPAIALGLQCVGPKLAHFAAQATIPTQNMSIPAKIHCWRGGMRSSAMAWLLGFTGMETITLKGGYKTFRHWVLEQFAVPRKFMVLGGMTGSGKSAALQELAAQGEQILDLETLANHRGSAYGRLGMTLQQPSTEHFENEIAVRLAQFDASRPIWVEDESCQIGSCHIPTDLFSQMQQAPMKLLNTPKIERIQRLLAEYGHFPKEHLIVATEKIGRHLGGQRKKEALTALESGDIAKALEIVLEYYDSAYAYSMNKRKFY